MTLIHYLLALIAISCVSSQSSKVLPNCSRPLLLYFPGSGWDLLTDADRSPLFDTSYSKCHLTPDGLYTIPDNVIVEPVRESKVHLFSEMVDDVSSYTSLTSKSFASAWMKKNSLGAPASILGTYSSSFLKAKRRLIENNVTIARIHIRKVLYRMRLSSTAVLHPDVLARLKEIASLYKDNYVVKARYLLELFVSDYGTHFTTHIDVGALLVEENDVSNAYLKNGTDPKNLVAEVAGQLFLKMVNFRNDFPSDLNRTIVKNYQTYRMNSFVESIGGSDLKRDMTIDAWLDGVSKNPVIIDRGGESMLRLPVVVENELLKLSRVEMTTLQDELQKTLRKYLAYNTRSGCTDPAEAYFDYSANIGDASCYGDSFEVYTFGGLYQTCETTSDFQVDPCKKLSLNTKNPLTGTFSCPRYHAANLIIDDKTYWQCDYQCNSTTCQNACYRIRAFWCSTRQPRATQVHFGGIYSHFLPNRVTGQYSCSPGDDVLRLGTDTFVCTRNTSHFYQIFFGGFFTDYSVNPFASLNGTGGRFECPTGYTENVAIFELPLNLSLPVTLAKYCISGYGMKNRYLDLPLVSPPFTDSTALLFAPIGGPPNSSSGLSLGSIMSIFLGILLLFAIAGLVIAFTAYLRIRNRNGTHGQNEPLISETSEPQS